MPSGNRGFSFIFAALLVVLGVGQVRSPKPTPSSKAATEAPTPPGSDESVAGTPAAPNCCFCAVPPSPVPPPKCADAAALLKSYANLYRGGFEGKGVFTFLIALVPDPEESGYPDYFDAVREGVEDAVAAGTPEEPQGYVLDHRYLPWPGSDAAKRKDGCWATEPGVLLFRPVGDPESASGVAVLLVGETPTWGIRPQQLAAALKSVEHWGDDDSYRILGPTFSGSAPSLAAAIRQHVREVRESEHEWPLDFDFRIASGTATGDGVEPTLESLTKDADIHVDYRAAIPEGGRLLDAIATFLTGIGGSRTPQPGGVVPDTVILSESGTAYGESVGTLGEFGSEPHRNGRKLRFEERRFPPNLVSLRRAYGEVRKGDHESPSIRAPSDTHARPEEERGELSEQTPVSHDLALAALLKELSEKGCRNIGIIATDARDVVFMAERIKEQLPDVRLFTIGFDIRYLHPDHAASLNGMLVAHTTSEEPRGASTVLKSPMTRGVSDAGRWLLAWPDFAPEPSISLLGNGVLRQIGGRQLASQYLQVPPGFTFVYWTALLGCVGVLLLVVGPTVAQYLGRTKHLPPIVRSSGLVRQRTAFWATLGNCQHLDLAADHAFATAALLTVTLGVPCAMTASVLRFRAVGNNITYRWGVGVFATLAALALGLIWLSTRGKLRSAGRSAWLLGSSVGAVACLSTSLGCAKPREANLYLLSGGSPLVAALLGLSMLVVVAWCWRARLRLLDSLRFGALPGARFFDDLPLSIAQLCGHDEHSELGLLERRLVRVLRSPWTAAPLVPIFTDTLLVGSIGFVFLTKPVLTFEAGFRHWFLIVFVSICILPITTNFARLIVTSRALMRLLRVIATLPILDALRKLPPELARRLETQLASGGEEVRELRHPVASLGRLAHVEPEFAAVAQQCELALRTELSYEAGGSGAVAGGVAPSAAVHGPAELADRLLETSGVLAHWPKTDASSALIAEYQAGLLAIFVARYVRQLRLLVPPLLVGSLLAVLMTSLYFVQPQHLIASVCFVWIAGMTLGVVAVYAALARDATISAIGKTDAGSVTPSWSLAGRVLAAILVPLASLLASQYPEFAFRVSSLLGVFARAMH